MNWLDVGVVVLFAICVIEGAAHGFARTAIGFLAFVAGVFCGLWLYPGMATLVRPWVHSKEAADGIGFLLIFAAFGMIGAGITFALSRVFKAHQLGWLDRGLGAGFGLIRGAFLAAVAVLVLMAFGPKPVPHAVLDSQFAPPLVNGAVTLSAAAPDEVRSGFRRACSDIERTMPEQWKKTLSRLRVDRI